MKRLDELEQAHRAVGGGSRGRRFTTQQINPAYVVLLAAEFQGFCRDLHLESVDALVAIVTPLTMQVVLHQELTRKRRLTQGNADYDL